MIKINLLAQRRRAGRGNRAQQEILLGVLLIIAAGVLVWLFVQRPLSKEISGIKDTNSKLNSQNQILQGKLKDEKMIQAAVKQLEEREASIAELQSAQATPAYMLRELARLMTANRLPTMTHEMRKEVEGGSLLRKFSTEWDPKHAWITSFQEKKGDFTLRGGAQSDGDVTQLAKRLEASVYFQNVVSQGATEVEDHNSGITYFQFTITGKVIY